MKYGSCLKKLKRILAVALALALLLNGWSNYDLSVKAEANEETVESTEEEETIEEEVTTEASSTEETTAAEETQTTEETTVTEGTSETQENTETTEETAEETTEAEETAAAQESTETAEEETGSLTIVESFSLGVTKLLGSIPALTSGLTEDVTVSVKDLSDGSNSEIEYSNTVQLTATATTVDNPTEVSGFTWEWSTNDDTVATVDSDGLVTAVGVGIATITAEPDSSSGYSGSGTYQVTVVQAKNTISGITFTYDGTSYDTLAYGDPVMTLDVDADDTTGEVTFTVNDNSGVVTYDQTEKTLTINKPGTFTIAAKVAESTNWKEATYAETTHTVSLKEVSVIVDDSSYTMLEKASDGSDSLDTDSLTTNQNIVKGLFNLDGLVSGDESDAILNVEETMLSALTYDSADIGSRTVSLASLVPDGADSAFSLTGGKADYYTLDVSTVKTKVLTNAYISPVSLNYYVDMTTEKDNIKITYEDDAAKITLATLNAGTPGSDDTNCWYTSEGLSVTPESGYTLYSLSDSGSLSAYSADTDGNYWFKDAANGAKFYIKAADDVYYGPVSVSFQIDEDAPTIEVTNTEVFFAKSSTNYTLTITDSGSGVLDSTIQYWVGAAGTSIDTIDGLSSGGWQTPASITYDSDNGTASFEVAVPNSGYLYVKAKDYVGNTKTMSEIHLVILEAYDPKVTLKQETSGVQQSHTVTVTASDKDTGETAAETYYSGIQSITYVLVNDNDEEETYSGTIYSGTDNMPANMTGVNEVATILDRSLDLDDSGLNGTYTLTVTAKDWCGNEGSAEITSLLFDNTPPELTAAFSESDDDIRTSGENEYYNTDMTVTFTITDTYVANGYSLDTDMFELSIRKDGTDYTVDEITQSGDISVSEEVDADGVYVATITVPASEEGEGVYVFSILGEDGAGNKLDLAADSATMTENTADSGNWESGTKIMDRTAPIVTDITSSVAGNGPYDSTDYYYNKNTLTVTFTLEDTYLPDSWAGSSWKCDGAEVSAVGSYTAPSNDGSTAKIEFSLSADGKYTDIAVYGEDLAGNELELANNFTYNDCNSAASSADGKVTLDYGKVVDTVAPTAVITYTETDSAHLYTGDDKIGMSDVTTAYYNTDITATIVITDTYGNNIKTNLDQTKLYTGEGTSDEEASGIVLSDAGSDVDGIAKVNKTYTESEDGRYYYIVYGTDRAGNALKVQEVNPSNSGDKTTSTSAETGYTPNYMLVRDTVAPTFTLTVTPASSVTNKNLQEGRYYFNGSYTATVAVDETNFDSERVTVMKGSVTSGSYDASTVSITDFGSAIAYSGDQNYTDSADTTNGVYRYEVYGTDKAGNALEPSDSTNLSGSATLEEQVDDEVLADLSCYIVVDTVDPTGTLTVNDYYEIDIAENSVSKSEPYRQETSATVNIVTDDRSPVLIGYTIDSTVDGTSAKSAGYGYQQTASTAVSGEQVFAVTGITVTDRAGNQISLGTTNSIYLDVTPPTMDTLAPTISVEAETNDSHHSAEGTPLFSKDVPLHIVVTDPYGGTRSSGLSTVTYQLYINGDEVTGDAKTLNPTSTTSWSNNYSDPTLTFTIDETITVDADSHNYNDIEVIVNAVDNAGNTNTRTYSFGIDTTAPTIEITYDNNDAENEKYFKAARTATIVVTERNFDSDLISISTESRAFSGWDYEAGSSANGDDDTWTATIAYNVDGDYTLTVEGEDLLGHEADVTYEGVATREFTIDMTAPTIELTFDNNNVANGKYYNASRTATLTVTDVNFAGTSDIAVLASGGGAAPSFNFAGGYTSSATFSVDGVYSFSGTVTDLAGNVSLPVSCDEFVIDQTAPELEIFDIEDRSANNGEVRPGVRYSDTNYDASATSIVLTGYYNGVVEMNGTTTYTENGLEIKLDDFEYVQDMDDMYTMEAVVYDLAGNSSEDSVLFSVNRFGSVYIYDDDTAALVGEDGSYYTNEEQDIVVTETNVDTLEFKEITLNLDGSLTTLVEGEDYTVDESGTDVSWKQYTYTIDEENFVDEGTYIVTIYSEDRATNTSDNNTKGKKIEFVVDKTNPSILISGVEEDGQYREASREVTLDVEDNIQMAEVVVEVDGVETTYSASEVLEADGKIVMTVGSANHWQSIRVTALDVAGNVRTASVERFLITPNIFVQFYMNKVLFWSVILILLLLLLAAWWFFIIAKRRKKKDEEQ